MHNEASYKYHSSRAQQEKTSQLWQRTRMFDVSVLSGRVIYNNEIVINC